jgi:hypothetical protein
VEQDECEHAGEYRCRGNAGSRQPCSGRSPLSSSQGGVDPGSHCRRNRFRRITVAEHAETGLHRVESCEDGRGLRICAYERPELVGRGVVQHARVQVGEQVVRVRRTW